MSASIDSPLWYRVAHLAPRLRAQVRVRMRHDAGQLRYVLADTLTGRHHLVEEAGWAFIGRLDGHSTVADIWANLQTKPPAGKLAPTQAEVLDWLGALDSAGLLQHSGTACAAGAASAPSAPSAPLGPDIGELLQGQNRQREQRRSERLNPLSWRVTWGDPSDLLRPFDGVARVLFTRAGAAVWLVLMLLGGVLALTEAPALSTAVAQQLGSARFIFFAWLAYPLIKLLHEAGHAMALRRFGGAVRQCGIAFLYGFPAPFVDASAASGFVQRRHRLVVTAAGIAVELSVAVAALLLWQTVQPGWLQDAALAVATTSAVSTLLANANPLVRMDGYHLLCDALSLPNLALRSRRFWLERLRAKGLRLDVALRASRSRLEYTALLLYAPAAWCMALTIAVAATVWLAGLSPALSLLVATLAAWALLLKPLVALLRWLMAAPELHGKRLRSAGIASAAVGGLALVVLAMPLPRATTVHAVAWMPEEALVRAQADGFAGTPHVASDARVVAGTALLQLHNPDLPLAVLRARAQRVAAEMDEARALNAADSTRATRARAEAQAHAQREAELEARVAGLHIHSARAGRISWVRPQQLPGRWVQRGEVLGHVLSGPDVAQRDTSIARAVVPESDAATLLRGVHSVSVRTADIQAQTFAAQWDGRMPQASNELPSAALGSAGGGAVESDTTGQHNTPHSREPVMVVDVQVPGLQTQAQGQALIGQRLYVRFDHGTAPLAVQAWQRVQQQLLRHWGRGPAVVGWLGTRTGTELPS
jgi:putative peptide zinc metalloprotease protein